MNLYEDRISNFLDGCHGAGIKDPIAFMLDKRIRVFDWLRGAFPRGVIPTDIDAEVELNRRFLRLEFKHEDALRSGRVSKGQRNLLIRLAQTGLFTVFVVGEDNIGRPTCLEVIKSNGTICKLEETSYEDMRERCSKWGQYVESLPKWDKPLPQLEYWWKKATEFEREAFLKTTRQEVAA
jgi:hypothetical protein